MSSVGYGDFVVEGMMLRIISVMVIILGSFISSALTLTILDFFKLTETEKKAYIGTTLLS